jgi:hypothetical protein
MCCRACPDYEKCRLRDGLRDDCCEKCPYFEICMEAGPEIDREGGKSKMKRRANVL